MAEAARRHNFDLDKSVGLKDIDLQRDQLVADRSAGLRDIGRRRDRGVRDIGTQRELGVEAAVNNALQRGIFRSGIRERNVGRVEDRAGEAKSDLLEDTSAARTDLRGDIDRALARLTNQRRGVSGKKFIESVGGGGGSGLDTFYGPIMQIINDLLGNQEYDFTSDLNLTSGIRNPHRANIPEGTY